MKLGLSLMSCREDFAKICFETLLKYSLLDNKEHSLMNGNRELDQTARLLSEVSLSSEDSQVTNKLAVTSLLHRFQEVLCKYIADEKLSAPVPLAAHRVAEMCFVLKALATLISSLSRGQGEVDSRTWGLVIGLYPHLVEATATQAAGVSSNLKQALHQYKDLLQAPSPAHA